MGQRLLVEVKIYQTSLKDLHIDFKYLDSLKKEDVIGLLEEFIKSYKERKE